MAGHICCHNAVNPRVGSWVKGIINARAAKLDQGDQMEESRNTGKNVVVSRKVFEVLICLDVGLQIHDPRRASASSTWIMIETANSNPQLFIFSQLASTNTYVYMFICTVVLKCKVLGIVFGQYRYEDYPIKGPEAISHDASSRASFFTNPLWIEKAVLYFLDFIDPAVFGTMKGGTKEQQDNYKISPSARTPAQARRKFMSSTNVAVSSSPSLECPNSSRYSLLKDRNF